jgi:hypothetical protein
MFLQQLIVQVRKKSLLMQVQKDPAKLFNIKNLHAIATQRNDWTKKTRKAKQLAKEPQDEEKDF